MTDQHPTFPSRIHATGFYVGLVRESHDIWRLPTPEEYKNATDAERTAADNNQQLKDLTR